MKKIIKTLFLILIVVSCKYDEFSDPGVTGKSGSITRFAVSGNYMYALDQNKVLVYDISNPGDPILRNTVETDYGLETIIIYDGTIYLGSRTSLYILDISVPENPKIISKTDRAEAFFGGCDPVVVRDIYAYSTIKILANICGNISQISALITFDVSSKQNPVQVNSFPLNIPEGLGYNDNYLFVCDEGDDKIHIFDITVGSSPVYFDAIELTDPVDLITDGNRMIVSSKTDFVIYDISDINNIIKLSVIPKA